MEFQILKSGQIYVHISPIFHARSHIQGQFRRVGQVGHGSPNYLW